MAVSDATSAAVAPDKVNVCVAAALPLAPALELLRATRAYVAALLRQHPEGWERSVTLTRGDAPDDGSLPQLVRDDLRILAAHIYDHIDDIRRTREAHGR